MSLPRMVQGGSGAQGAVFVGGDGLLAARSCVCAI